MRILLTTMLFLVLCPLAGAALADDRSDCINSCAGDKRSNDMYCPPAGGYSDEDHRQCVEKNTTAYGDCVKACSPAAPPPEPPPAEPQPADPQPVPEPSSPPPEGPAAGDK
ncbi:hypothetical protein FO488_05255 [Geobacter sp. FeAm09]|uniref:hypothetical protein n=1 Tax=Geobacter sp. FeAm09 TaxID=2597769 RepID=UPI0011EC6F39|nr:hypothetical protein [Geobacter sp. FeAm09]QEM67617.1 hypothetical protein FO488_05255 [Geobacter sp. FeAm09]